MIRSRGENQLLWLDQIHLSLVWNWENADNDPRIRRNEMELLRCPKEEVQVGLRKGVEVFLSDLGDRRLLVPPAAHRPLSAVASGAEDVAL